MISQLRGQVVHAGPAGLVLDVGGIGYLVQPTQSVLSRARDGELTVQTYLHVREDALQLYGFAESAERELFEQLLSVSGIGPKVALSIVSGSSPDELRRAIALGDTARFEAIPGIGKKIAQRVVLELKELHQLSARETARQMGLSLSAVKARVFHGRKKLRKHITVMLRPRTSPRASQ